MPRVRRDFKPPNFDIPCPACSYQIPPRETLRVDGERFRCPQCKNDFKPEPKGGKSQQLNT
jgi:hypothetical protein